MKKKLLLFFSVCSCQIAIAQWTTNFQTPTQQIVEVLSSPTDSICWFITNRDSLYKTTNGGQSWTVHAPVAPSFIPSGLFVLNKDTAFKSGSSSLLKTTDGGNSWAIVFNSTGFEPPVVWMKNDLVGVLSFGGQLYKSTDGGDTWSTALITQPPSTSLNSDGKGTICNSGDSLWVAMNSGGIAFSPDYGVTWNVPSNTGLSFSSPGRIYFGSPQFGIAIKSNSSFIYVTTDSASHWILADNSLGLNQDVVINGSHCWYIPNPADHFYIKYSSDSGASWVQQLFDANGFDVLEKSRNGSTLWAGTEHGKIYTCHDLLPTNTRELKAGDEKFNIFPNPSGSSFTFESSDGVNKKYHFIVTDHSGKEVSAFDAVAASCKFGAALQPGCYLVSVFSGNDSILRKKIFKTGY